MFTNLWESLADKETDSPAGKLRLAVKAADPEYIQRAFDACVKRTDGKEAQLLAVHSFLSKEQAGGAVLLALCGSKDPVMKDLGFACLDYIVSVMYTPSPNRDHFTSEEKWALVSKDFLLVCMKQVKDELPNVQRALRILTSLASNNPKNMIRIINFADMLKGNMLDALVKAIDRPATCALAMGLVETLGAKNTQGPKQVGLQSTLRLFHHAALVEKAFQCISLHNAGAASGLGFFAELATETTVVRSELLQWKHSQDLLALCNQALESGPILATKACACLKNLWGASIFYAKKPTMDALVKALDADEATASAVLDLFTFLADINVQHRTRLILLSGFLSSLARLLARTESGAEKKEAAAIGCQNSCLSLLGSLALCPGEPMKVAIAQNVGAQLILLADMNASSTANPKGVELVVSVFLYLYTTPDTHALLDNENCDLEAIMDRVRKQTHLTPLTMLRTTMLLAELARVKGRDVKVATEVTSAAEVQTNVATAEIVDEDFLKRDFIPSPTFSGARTGFEYRKGPAGMGYYRS